MELCSRIYVSRMTDQCDLEEVHKILEISRTNNARSEITGLLCYDSLYFMQCLEGPQKAVEELYYRIVDDDRHTDVLLLDNRSIRERSFGNWQMAFLKMADVGSLLDGIAKNRKFDPFAIGEVQARTLFDAFAGHLGAEDVRPN